MHTYFAATVLTLVVLAFVLVRIIGVGKNGAAASRDTL